MNAEIRKRVKNLEQEWTMDVGDFTVGLIRGQSPEEILRGRKLTLTREQAQALAAMMARLMEAEHERQ
jgi:hypothetical protein